MDTQYIQILRSIDNLKRICPNMRLENVQILAVNGDEFGTQQVILAQDQPSIMISNNNNDNQIQQIVYQPPIQGQLQQGQTHFVIQDDETHQEYNNQQVYYTTDIQSVDNSNVIQTQLQQTNSVTTSQHTCETIQQPVVLQQNPQQQQHIFVPNAQQVIVEHQQTTIQQQTQTVVQNQQSQQQTHIISTNNSPQQILQNHQVVMHTSPVTAQAQEQQSHIMMARPQQRQFIYNTTADQRIVYENPPPQNTQQHIVTQTIQQTQVCQQNQILQQTNMRTTPPQRILQHSLQQQRIANINQNQRMILNTDNIRQQISIVNNNSMPRARQCMARPRFRQNIVKTNTPRMLPHAIIRPHSRDNPRMARASQQCNIRQLSPMQIQQQIMQQQRKINAVQPATFTQVNPVPINDQNDIVIDQPQPEQQVVRLPIANNTVQRMATPVTIQLPKKQTKVTISPTGNFIRNTPPIRLPIESKRPYTRTPVSSEYNILVDLEDSITAAVVSKNPNPVPNQIIHPTTTNVDQQQQDLAENMKQTIQEQLNGAPCSSDQEKIVTLANGEKMTLAKYKSTYNNHNKIPQQEQQQQPQQQQQQSSSITHNFKTTPQRGGKASANRQLTKKIINNKPLNQQMQQEQIQDEEPVYEPRESARMLVILQNGEQRLITFTLPKDSCTVQELLEQVGVSFSTDTNIQCVSNPGADIEYVVTVGVPAPDSSVSAELFDNSIILPPSKPQTELIPTQTMIKTTAKELPTKIIPGLLAVCRDCGFCGNDHAKCQRCKRIFLEEPKQIPAMSSSTKIKNTFETSDKEKKDLENIQRKHQIGIELSSKAIQNNVTTPQSSRGRGRGRGRGRSGGRVSKHVEVEPVILTLSSDDEADTNSNDSKKFTDESAQHFKVPLSCEPIIPEDDGSTNDMVRENVADVSNSVDSLYTSFQCRTIRIGTLKYTPTENVIFSAKGIRIIAPNVKTPKENIILDLQTREIIKLVAHFSKSLSVIFIFTIPSCSTYVRDSLQMNKFPGDASPYYNSTHRLDYYKKIILLMDSISEDSKSVIKAIYAISVLEEVSHHDANELLNRSKEIPIPTNTVTSANNSTSEDIRQILIYPSGKGGISINTEDYMCLAIDQYLNDVIIDFYLNYLKLDKLSDEQRSKTHIFSSFFYNRLTKVTTRQRVERDRDVKLTPSQKRHERVKNWTKHVNIFDKDFVIIPINEQSHWFLAIICFPGLKGPFTIEGNNPVKLQSVKKKCESKRTLQIGSTTITPLTSKKELDSVLLGDDSLSERDEAEADDSDLASDSESDIEVEPATQAIKQPCILIFDSLAGASRSRVVATLRDYLTCEYKIKIIENTNHTFNKLNIPGHCVKVPQQNNFTDCGLYLLQYVEQFFKDPIKDYRLPIKQLNNWFDTLTVTRKREEISDLLKSLIMRLNPERLPLPDIAFPTLNGTLVEQDTSLDEEQGEAEFEEEEMGEEDVDDIEEEDELNESTTGETEEESTPDKPKNGTKLTTKRCIEDKVKIDFVAKKTARLDDT